MTVDSPGQSEQAKDSPDPFASIAQATPKLFEPHLSSSFFVDPKSAIVSPSLEHLLEQIDMSCLVELTLVEVTRYTGAQSNTSVNSRESFSLLFCGSHQQPLISAIYTISHPELVELNLFLNPVHVPLEQRPEEHPDGFFYEACFA